MVGGSVIEVHTEYNSQFMDNGTRKFILGRHKKVAFTCVVQISAALYSHFFEMI